MTWPRPATLQLLSAVLSDCEANFKLNHVTISPQSDHTTSDQPRSSRRRGPQPAAAGGCWWLLVAAGGCWRRHGHAGAGQLGHAVAGRRAADLGPGGEENAGWRDALQHVGAGGCLCS